MSSLMAGCFGIDFVNAETGKSHMFSVFSELNEVSLPEILKRYEFYDLHRDFFPDFEEFYPELIKVFGMEIDNE